MVAQNLYAAFQAEAGNDYNVTAIMDGWLTQRGYPVVDVKVAKDRKRIAVTQKRFLTSNPNHHDKTVWNVPLTYASNKENTQFSNTKPTAILSNSSMEIVLSEPIDWIVFNVQETGIGCCTLAPSFFGASFSLFRFYPTNRLLSCEL